ncbi:MMPL family transporter [Nocardia asteroides]|uniref:MMPL family transporter n=1 Tax=Nocardia asteroides TaxID=1824 RepID=UPI003648E8DB
MRAAAAALTARNINGVTGIQVTPPSENRLVQVFAVQMTKPADAADKTQGEAVRGLREQLREQVRDTGLRAGITGTAAQTLDQTEQGEKGMAIIGIATIVLILVLLLVIFRSPVIALLPVITIGAISSMVGGLIAMNDDYRIVFPVAAIVIMLVLALLLRSLVAPWYLMGLGVPRLRRDPGRDGAGVPPSPGRARADLHTAGDHVPVRRRARHRLQHPESRSRRS